MRLLKNSTWGDNLKQYCAKCGMELNTFESRKWRKIGEIDLGGGRIIAHYGTACCGAKVFSTDDIKYDYYPRLVADGYERIENADLTALVTLCCKIGKSPFAIRMYKTNYGLNTIFYFDVKAGHHKDALHEIFNDQLERANA
jgi:hypothetical protein